MIGSSHWLASMAGWSMLERGGNAFDAAVATGLALQIVEPNQNGPGGEMPAVLYSAARRRVEVICGQGVAPRAATITWFRQQGLELIPGTGLTAACVPGAFDAWMLLLLHFGTLTLRDVITPAICYARQGYVVAPLLEQHIAESAELFLAHWPSSAETYLVRGEAPRTGTLHRNPRLADTYERLLREAEHAGGGREGQIEAARRIFYEGFIAEEIDRFCRGTAWVDSSGEPHGGLLTGDDMAVWRASVEAPATYDYLGYAFCKCSSWSQGPVLLQQLALLKCFDLTAMDPLGPDFVHMQIEAAKLAFADREAWYGDVADAPLATLLSESYNQERQRLIRPEAALAFQPGAPDGRIPRLAQFQIDRGPAPSVRRPGLSGPVEGDTVHLDAVDYHGNMISCMPSGGWLQASPVIPRLGFCLGTRLQMFWLEDGLPSSLEPGRRPRTTLSPGLALRDGEPVLAFGSSGGDQQDQWALTSLLRHLHHGYDLQAACDAPAFHSEHAPSSFHPRMARHGAVKLEGRFPAHTVEGLRRRGHRVEVVGDWELARTIAVGRDRIDGAVLLKGGAQPRYQQHYVVGR